MPEQAIITHLGMRMIFEGPSKEAKIIEKETEVPTIAAIDGMRISFAEEIRVKLPAKRGQSGLNAFI